MWWRYNSHIPVYTLSQLYRGQQCLNCGIRTSDYAAHLDWHFKTNRENKRITSRAWYPSAKVWSGEVEHHHTPSTAPSNRNKLCPVCHEKFEDFYHQDNEEWMLNNAVENKGIIYHPLCLKDHQKSTRGCSM